MGTKVGRLLWKGKDVKTVVITLLINSLMLQQILGLDSAGKTTLLYKLKLDTVISTVIFLVESEIQNMHSLVP
jgi:ABC-type phosphate/phosphonate transport system ATPase subunit